MEKLFELIFEFLNVRLEVQSETVDRSVIMEIGKKLGLVG